MPRQIDVIDHRVQVSGLYFKLVPSSPPALDLVKLDSEYEGCDHQDDTQDRLGD